MECRWAMKVVYWCAEIFTLSSPLAILAEHHDAKTISIVEDSQHNEVKIGFYFVIVLLVTNHFWWLAVVEIVKYYLESQMLRWF